MSQSIQIELLGAPRGKGRPRFSFKTRRAYTDAATESYEGDLKVMASLAMKGRAPLEGPVRLVVLADVPIPESWSRKKREEALSGVIRPTTKPDADNILKLIADGLNQIVWVDDKQVVDLRMVKQYAARPRLWISVEPLLTVRRVYAARELEAS